MELRKSISSYLKEFCAMYVRPEQIIIGAGTEYLYSILIQLLGRNVCYGVENPGYPKIAKIYRSMGVKYEYIDLDEEGTSAKKLEEKKVDIALIYEPIEAKKAINEGLASNFSTSALSKPVRSKSKSSSSSASSSILSSSSSHSANSAVLLSAILYAFI